MEAPCTKHEFRFPEPTYCKLKHKVNFLLGAKLDHIRAVLKAFLACRKQHEKLLSESKLLRIMIFKRNGQLRREKSLQLLKRVQACLKRVDNFEKVFKVVSDIYTDLESSVSEIKGKRESYLPSQQTWSYLLYLQLQYVELLKATASYCCIAFEHLSCHLATGMLIPQMLMFMGAAARVWTLSRTMVNALQQFYNQIYPVREHIQRTQSDWKDPELPPKLYTDINGEVNPELADRLSEASRNTVSETDKDINIEATQGIIEDNKALNAENTGRSAIFSLGVEEEEDLGVPIDTKRKADTSADENFNTKRRKTDDTTTAKGASPKKKRKKKTANNASGVSDQISSSAEAIQSVERNKHTKQEKTAKSKPHEDSKDFKSKSKKKLKKITRDSVKESSTMKESKLRKKKTKAEHITMTDQEYLIQSYAEKVVSVKSKREPMPSNVKSSAAKKLKKKKSKVRLGGKVRHVEAVIDTKPVHPKKKFKMQKIQGVLGVDSKPQAAGQKRKKDLKRFQVI